MPNNEIKLKILIDNREATASLKLTDENIKELYKSFKYGKQEVNGLITSISQGFNNAREIIQGFREAFNVISQSFSTHLTAYQEQEAALIKLETALKQTNQFTKENVNSLTDYAAKLQNITVYGDDVTESVMAQLLAMGLNVEQTKQATLQAANLATVMGTDLNTAARAMADLFNGSTGMIGRYIKGLDETIIKSGDLDKILAMLNERIGGQAEAMGETSIGAIARMNNAIGDLKENTGLLLTNALSPFIRALSDIIQKLNNISPDLSGLIGLIGTITTVFITLRVTGIMPAITSLNLFGTTITGLRLTLIKSGLGALIVGLGYLLSELAKRFDHFQQTVEKGKASYEDFLNKIRKDAINANKTEMDFLLNDAEIQKSKLEAQINKLKADIKKAKMEVITKDKEGNVYKNYYETEESKKLEQQLKQTEYLLKLENDKLSIYNEIINKKRQGKKLTDEELKKEFELANKKLTIEQQHETNMLKIKTDNENIQLLLEQKHLEEKRKLYKKYAQDVTEINYRLIENEAKLYKNLIDTNTRNFEIAENIKINLKTISSDKLTEIEKKHAEQVAKITKDLTEFEKWLYDENVTAQMQMQMEVFNFIAAGFNKYTVIVKAVAVFEAILRARLAFLQALQAFPPPLNFAMAALVAISAAKQVNDIVAMQPPKAKGFQQGGRLPAGRAGFVEGYANEIIAPEKTFVEIFKSELRPQIYSNLQSDYSPLLNELREQNRRIENWQRELTFKFDNGEFIAGMNKLQSKYNRLKF